MKIYAIHNNTGSRYYRLIPQLKELQRLGHDVIIEPHDSKDIEQNIKWADIIIFQMIFSEELIKLAKGKKVIFECDDMIHKVPKDHYAYSDTKGLKGVKLYLQARRIIKKCDGFISTTKELDKTYGKWTKSLIFPNYIDLPHWLKKTQNNTTDRIRILWAGSKSHSSDMKVIKPTMERIMKKYPQVQFIYIGWGGIKSNDLQAKFIYGEDIWKGLPDNREAMLPVPPNVFPYILSSLQADIAIAPLEKNYFNKFKSQCKYLEYSINKIPAVYSEWHYKDVKDGKTGLLAGNWEECLTRLIESKDLRDKIGQNAYDDVIKNHDIRNYISKWTRFVL